MSTKGVRGEFSNHNQLTTFFDPFLGRNIWFNMPGAYAFYTLLPPNSPNCASTPDLIWTSASSHHTEGVNVSFLDGSVRFISNTIDVRNLDRRVISTPDAMNGTPDFPADENGRFSYGVWAELGAVNSTEAIPSL